MHYVLRNDEELSREKYVLKGIWSHNHFFVSPCFDKIMYNRSRGDGNAVSHRFSIQTLTSVCGHFEIPNGTKNNNTC